MSDISKVLVREGIIKADCLDDKLTAVARAVSQHIDTIPEGILYEIEVARALGELYKKGQGSLRQSDADCLAKPAKNNYYGQFGVKSLSLRDAIVAVLQELDPTKPVEVRYEESKPQGTMQQYSFKVVLYKDDEKLRQYIRSRASLYPKVVYTFAVPEGIATVRNGIMQRNAR
jgi:hypothetical protein